MKRILIVALIACLLLCGCQEAEPAATTTLPSAAPTTDPTAAATTEPTVIPTTEPTEAQPEFVTVYLLTEVAMFDSGYTTYEYDEDYNIDLSQTYSLEKELMYTTYYENKDENGMAGCVRNAYVTGDSDSMLLKHFADGKLEEELYEGSNYSGYQYAYDQKGDRTEKREYWDGILTSAIYYIYDGETLVNVYCEDAEGTKIFDCEVVDGRIVEKTCYNGDTTYGYTYEYDENGNVAKSSFLYEGEVSPSETYTYQAVEVEADRACYLLEQQKYLINIP